MKILALARASPSRPEGKEESSSAHERTGLFTTGIVSTTRQGQRIVTVLHGTEARRGEPRPGVGRAGQGTRAAHSDV